VKSYLFSITNIHWLLVAYIQSSLWNCKRRKNGINSLKIDNIKIFSKANLNLFFRPLLKQKGEKDIHPTPPPFTSYNAKPLFFGFACYVYERSEFQSKRSLWGHLVNSHSVFVATGLRGKRAFSHLFCLDWREKTHTLLCSSVLPTSISLNLLDSLVSTLLLIIWKKQMQLLFNFFFLI
jgi:hypothetical protein